MTGSRAPSTPREEGVPVTGDAVLSTWRWEPSVATDGSRHVLLVHGLASNAQMWGGVGRALAAAGHTAVAVDQRGHGRSTRPGGRFDAETLRDDLVRVIEHHELRETIAVGQSWGGNVVLDLAYHHDAEITAAVAVDGGAIDLQRTFPDLDSALDAMRPPPLAGTPYTAIERAVRERHADWPEEGIQAALANFLVRDDGTVEPRLALDDHLAIIRALWDQPSSELLRDLDVPALLLLVDHGDEHGWSATARRIVDEARDANPHVAVRWLEGYEHDVHAQAPDLVATTVLEWLTEALS